MRNSNGAHFSVLCIALLCTAALVLVGHGSALARVGVTSATDGDPLGKPPAEPQRVLRIGIDVQANEVITTSANDRAHLVFLDGSSLTVGPNAQLTIDKFVYDPNTKTGELAVSATKGVLRLVGGRISKTTPITITTPSSTIGIRGGISIVEVQQSKTTAAFVFGNSLTVAAPGLSPSHTRTVTRPGFVVTTVTGGAPSMPAQIGPGGLTKLISVLEGGQSSGGSGNAGGSGGAGAPSGGGRSGQTQQANAAEQGAQNFGKHNSAQGPVGGPQGAPGGPVGGRGGNQGNALGNINNNPPVANTNSQSQKSGGINPVTSTTNTTVVVSRGTLGRYLADPIYSNFSNSDLSVTLSANNYRTLSSPSNVSTTTTTTTRTSSSGTSTTTSSSTSINLTVTGLGSITLPWVKDTLTNGFSISNLQALGANLKDGRGYVSTQEDFFAYVFTTSGNDKVGVFGGVPTNTSGITNFPTSGVGTFIVRNIGEQARMPFTNDTVGGNTDLQNAKVVSNLYTAWSTTLQSTIGSPIPDARATALQASISISGTGNNQKSYMGVFIGQFLSDIDHNGSVVTRDNGQYLAGNFNGTYRTSSDFSTADGKVGRLVSNEATPSNGTGNGNAIYGSTTGDGAVSGFVLTPDRMESSNTGGGGGGNVTAITTNRTAQASFAQPYTNLSGSDYYTVTLASKTPTSSSVGVSRTDTTGSGALRGFIGGIVEQVDSSSNFSTRTVTTTDPTTLALRTDPTTNRASAEITVGNWDTSTSATFKLGGTTSSNVSTSAFIDDNIYALRDRPGAIGNSTEIAGSSSSVTSNTAMVSYNTAAIDSLFTNAGVTKCTCSFLTWGWWGGDIAYSNASTYNPDGRDRMNLATYVAGTLAQSTQLPLTGSATYNGMLVGGVNNNGRQYIQAGSYQNVWNFANRTGATSVSFDGTSFNGTTSASVGSVQFSGSMTTSGKTLNLNGAFVGSGTPPQGQAGSFSVSGSNYKAAGVFAAQK